MNKNKILMSLAATTISVTALMGVQNVDASELSLKSNIEDKIMQSVALEAAKHVEVQDVAEVYTNIDKFYTAYAKDFVGIETKSVSDLNLLEKKVIIQIDLNKVSENFSKTLPKENPLTEVISVLKDNPDYLQELKTLSSETKQPLLVEQVIKADLTTNQFEIGTTLKMGELYGQTEYDNVDMLRYTTKKSSFKDITSHWGKEVERVMHQGIHVYTALQPEKQKLDEAAINRLLTVSKLQASATVIDNNTREIVSIYGGKDYKKYDLHRAFQSPRQPGSSFKPLSVYAPYFETTSATKNTIVNGGPYCVGNFCPENYGGYRYGNSTIETAFKHSYNTSALRLFNQIGVDTAFSYIDRFQFKSIIDKDRTYAAALGGLTYGVTTLEMADAYTSFIDGFYTPAHSIRKVTNLNG